MSESSSSVPGRLPGLLLVLAAALGLVLANLLPGGWLAGLWDRHWQPTAGVELPALASIVDEGLMALFFLVAGLEIRVELQHGSLQGLRRAALPLLAAAGGVLVPALIYQLLNAGLPQASGWAVPTATDIAFATGILALLPAALARPLRSFLLALAMIDDVIAVLVVLLCYSHGLHPAGLSWLLAAGGLYAGLRWMGVHAAWTYLLAGSWLWLGLWRCGLHPALAGMLLGLAWPVGRHDSLAAARRLRHGLEPWVAYLIMPLFALIHASIDLHGLHPVPAHGLRLVLGVVLGLVLGKPLGVLLVSWLAVRWRLAQLPRGLDWAGMALIGVLAGIGLTMAMFISTLALAQPESQRLARIAVLLASTIAASLAWGLGRWLAVRSRRT